MNGESLRNTVGIGGWGGSAIEPSFHDIHCSCGVDVYMYMKMIILFGSDVTLDSSVDAVMMHSLNNIFFTCVITFSRLRVCAGYVPAGMIKHCVVGCFVLCGTWLRIPRKHSSLRAALLCKYQESTCRFTLR